MLQVTRVLVYLNNINYPLKKNYKITVNALEIIKKLFNLQH